MLFYNTFKFDIPFTFKNARANNRLSSFAEIQ